MEVLGEDSLGLGVHKNNSVLFDKKTEATIFISNTTRNSKQL
jgi:hypothetical protein